MSTEPRRVEVTLESKVESMDLGEELAQQVAGTAGFDEDERYKISMAVRECLINALQHGNRGQAGKPIRLRFLLHSDRLVVEVCDQGCGFKLNGIPDPRSDEYLLKASGRGLFLIRCFMDDLQVECGRNGGALVTMTKRYSSNNKGPAASKAEKERQQ